MIVEYWFSYIDQALIFGVMAVSLNVLIGHSGIFSIGSSAFAAIGGYFTAVIVMSSGLGWGLALLLAILVGAISGAIVSAPILRLAEQYVMLMTLSLSILIVTIISSIQALGGTQGLFGLPTASLAGLDLLRPSEFAPWLVAILVVVALICWRLAESPFGRLLRASRDNDLGVRSLGKSSLPARVFTFALMSGFASLGGGLLVMYNGIASPSLFSLDQTMLIFAMVIVGGISSIPGSILGAVIIVALAPVLEQAVRLPPETAALVRPIVFGAILVLIMRFRPEGIIKERHRTPALAAVAALKPADMTPEQHVPVVDEAVVAEAESAAAGSAGVSAPVLTADRGPVVLEVQGLSKRFGGVVAVNDLTMQLRRGEITALIGANGAGKSTVFNLITGAIRPDSGTVTLGEQDITGLSPQRVARLGMVRSFQDLRVFTRLTPLENVMMAAASGAGEHPVTLFARPLWVRRHDRERAQEAAAWLEFAGVDPAIKAYTGTLSFAQQKQVAFARVLATKADIILLDEPLSGIEGSAVDELLALIERMRSVGHTVCIVEHSVQAVSRLADWAYFMESGHVTAEGTVASLLTDSRLTEAYFGKS